MGKSIVDISKHTDREAIMNLFPRVEALEEEVHSHGRRQDSLENAMVTLRNDLVATEGRISQKVDRTNSRIDERMDNVDNHLSTQDERLDTIVDSTLRRRRTWPDWKKQVVTGTVVLVAAVLTGISTGVVSFHF